jgi:hypothetical protein
MDGYLSNKPKIFVDDPEKLYRLRRHETQAKKLGFVDPQAEADGLSPKESPPPRPRENHLPPQSMGEQQQPEHKIGELCTLEIINLPILNLAEIRRLFEIKTLTIRIVQQSKPSPPSVRSTLSNIQHGQGDSKLNEGKVLSVLVTREGFAMVPLSTGGDGAKLGYHDESLHEGILLTG